MLYKQQLDLVKLQSQAFHRVDTLIPSLLMLLYECTATNQARNLEQHSTLHRRGAVLLSQKSDSFTLLVTVDHSCAVACGCSSWQQMSAGPGIGHEALQAGMNSQPCSPTERIMPWLGCSAWDGLTASSLRMWIACTTRLAPVRSSSCTAPPTGLSLFTADGIHLPLEVCIAFSQSADFLSCLLLHEMQCQDVCCFWLKA